MRGRRNGGWWGLIGAVALAPALARERPIELNSFDSRIAAPFNVASLNRHGAVALSGTPAKLGGFLPAFDRRLDTEYEPRDAGVAHILLTFARPQALTAVRLLPAEGEYEWQLESADSRPDLEGKVGSYRTLVTSQRRLGAAWAEARWPTPVSARLLCLTLRPITGDRVRVRELNLEGEQALESLSVQVKSPVLPVGERIPVEVMGFFTGGESRPLKSKEFAWKITPDPAARIDGAFLVGRRRGPVEVRVTWGKLASIPLPLQVVDAD